MSDILIRGMDMPKDIEPGLTIEFADGIDGKRYARLYHYQHGGLTEWCEAVSIPPHGRLIDADSKTFPMLHRNPTNDYMKGWNACLRSVQQQPTIIPAEEANHDK